MIKRRKNLLKGGIKRFMNNKEELINKLKDFTEVIKNCSGDCDNCDVYLTCFEKYSDQNLVNLLNETIEYIKGIN